MAEVRLQVLDVGQGSGNFVEIYTDANNEVLGATILVDLGTEKDPGHAAQNATIEYIRTTLCTMPEPTISLLVLSHSDDDHINLIVPLLSNFTPPTQKPQLNKPNLTIAQAWYAGEYDKFAKYNNDNVLAIVQKYMVSNNQPKRYECGFSSFNTDTPVCWDIEGVKVYTLIAQVVNERSTANKEYPYFINTRSAVLMLSYQGTQWILTGDATGRTLYEINLKLEKLGDFGRQTYLSNVFMLTAPHHGSKTTTYDVKCVNANVGEKRKKQGPDAQETVNKFVNWTKPLCLSASAERVKRFKHPHWTVLTDFSAKCGNLIYSDPQYGNNQNQVHAFTAFIPSGTFLPCPWPGEDGFYSANTQSNVFTNLYCATEIYYNVQLLGSDKPPADYKPDRPDPPPYSDIALGVTWEFGVNENGNGFVSKMDNRRLSEIADERAAARGVTFVLRNTVQAGDAVAAPSAAVLPRVLSPASLARIGPGILATTQRPRPSSPFGKAPSALKVLS
jgi:beta-lactamase superfamily II metal-dependent hydrolase